MALKIGKQESKEVSKPTKTAGAHHFAHILLSPRITEKASEKAMNDNVYIFNVLPSATKSQVRNAVMENFKVTPIKVSTVTVPVKQLTMRGKRGSRAGGKKAFVYLKKGDKIEFV